MAATRVVVVGLDTRRVEADDATYAAVRGMTGEAILRTLEQTRARLHALGFETAVCAVDAGRDVDATVRDLFARFAFDGVVVGGGLRLAPGHTVLLERLVNAVRRHAPGAAFCFDTGPLDTVEAVLRVFPQATPDDRGVSGEHAS